MNNTAMKIKIEVVISYAMAVSLKYHIFCIYFTAHWFKLVN